MPKIKTTGKLEDGTILAKERAYVRNVLIKGMPKYRAYREAGWTANTMATAWSGSRAVEARPRVQAYIAKIQAQLAAKAEHEDANEFLTFEEKRRYLARAVRTPIAEIDEHDNLANELRITANGDRTIKIIDKAKAIELDSRLMGEFKDTVKHEVSERVLTALESVEV